MTTLVQVLPSKTSVDKNLKMPTSISAQNPSSSSGALGSGDSTNNHQSEITSQLAQQGNNTNEINPTKNISQLSESIQRLDDLLLAQNGQSSHAAAPERILSRDSIGKDEWDNDDGGFPLEDDVSYNIPHSAAPESLHMALNGGSSFNSIEESGRSEIAESLTTTSLSSRGSTPSNSLPRPLLYSAIGSLENPNAASLGSYAKRLSNVDKASLLPPASAIVASAVASVANKSDTNARSNGLRNGSSQEIPDGSHGAKHSSHGNGTMRNDGQWAKLNEATGANSNNAVDSEGNAVNSLRNIVQAKSSLRPSQSSKKKKKEKKKRVSYDPNSLKSKKQVEMFRPSCDAYTPRIEKKNIKYKAAENRTPVQTMATTMGTLQRPNFRDALRRVAMIIHQHIVKIERRFESNDARLGGRGLFTSAMKDAFSEEKFCTPKYKCTMVRIPMARPGMVFGLRKIKTKYMIPSEKEIYEFAHQLFKSVQLSSECSIVCLIYVERLMEAAKVPLMACTWRPIFMCGLLLASKVWQDLSSWNIEFASVYPQFSLDAINKLEVNFLRNIKWDLYISSSLYAKYYFALRSLVEKVDFRQRYNRMVGRVDSVAQAEALKIQERSEA
eukprot:CAMPEP_0113651190 /NCGR_PEP_ID=MMETSP0017_2-20120614/27275_1 /TAXON_ID=2856 /ORGANISM="Cylindrotheca closterium" /LENGTH=611 /DNA_ID=CAMNT_0000563823 /DNA_START=82 /DNA_END=1914 /DNA_ORIENTATION=+ /assembly_acc=CAM_ASM_000147